MINILMIEDDDEIANFLGNFLSQYNISITNYESPILGLSALNIKKYDLVILDLSLPEIDGTEVCKLIRKKSQIPIIISSARSDIEDKSKCYAFGADDYIPKPYDPQELVLRINSILKRVNGQDETHIQIKKVFQYDDDKMEITKNYEVIHFTNAEYFILRYFIKKSGFSVTREELLTNVDSIKYESSLKSIDVLIGRIRTKIEENPKKPQYIISLRGIGYKLVNQ
ncbi:MAG: response regulator transcription factor [Arcobacteraceae bacterium]|nr:response regulator transcription factor [Arcobacteraceae bacterium]